MRRGNVLYGAALKSAAMGLFVFLLALAVMGVAIFKVVSTAMYAELEAQITEELILFEKIYEEGGRQALVASVRLLEKRSPPIQHSVGVFDEARVKLAGNINTAPDFLGFGKVFLTLTSPVGKEDYYVRVAQIKKSTIVVGRNLRVVAAVQDVLSMALAIAGMVVATATLLIGYLLSRRVSVKLNTLAGTLDRVAAGDTAIRVPVGLENDQIDRMSRQINMYLERLSALMESTRNTANAIAHDLRTPLNRAYLTLQEAAESATGNDATACLIAQAETELEDISRIFDTMLRIARIEASGDNKAFEHVPVDRMLEEIAETYEAVVEEARQSFRCDVSRVKGKTIFCDRRMVRQMIANLIDNASFHCPVGTSIFLSAENASSGRVLIEVADTGPGIPPEERDRVLRPFYRLNASRSEKCTGLGLSLVKAIAVCHRARLSLDDGHPGLKVSICFDAADTA